VYQLALRLGYASPSRMLAEMRRSELALWLALWQRDPWGEQRADLRAANIALVSATAGLKKKSGEKWEIWDFMPFAKKPVLTAIESLRERFGHRIVKKDKP